MKPLSPLAFLLKSAGISRSVAETAGQLNISGPVVPSVSDSVADHLSALGGAPGWNVRVLDGESDEIPLDRLSGKDVNITITKPTGRRLYFATLQGFGAALSEKEVGEAIEVRVLGDFRPFATRRFRVEPWEGAPLPPGDGEASTASDSAADPRRTLVRDLTGMRVPEDALRWLPSGKEGEGPEWEAWQREAVQRLALIPASEVWDEAGEVRVCLQGARKRVFSISSPTAGANIPLRPLADAVEWIVFDRGADAKHEMLVRRLAAIVPEGAQDWTTALCGGIKEAWEGAKVDFRAYAKSKSSETLKAIADIRKAVGDDVSRIVERTQRLSNGLVVSIVALTAGLAIRLVMTVVKAEFLTSVVFAAVVLAATWAGVLLQRHVNTSSLRGDLNNMRKWHRRIHTSLSREEYRDIAMAPVRDAVKLYKSTLVTTQRALCVSSAAFALLVLFLPMFK